MSADPLNCSDGPAATPRLLAFVTVKRNWPLLGRSYGHWWIELDGVESYGWWPAEPVGLRGLFSGTPGVLNDHHRSGGPSPSRDPQHGLPGDFEFHPVLVTAKTDDQVRTEIRRFAQSFLGPWRWSVHPTMNCRLFQLALFDAVGIVDGTGNYRSRGAGCPALSKVRRLVGRLTGRRLWPSNLPAPGQRVTEVLTPRAVTSREHQRLVR